MTQIPTPSAWRGVHTPDRSDKVVMQQALDALLGYKPHSLTHAKEQSSAIIALREAIAQPVQPTSTPEQPADKSELLTDRRLINLAIAARAALPQLCDMSSKGQAERVALEKAIEEAEFIGTPQPAEGA